MINFEEHEVNILSHYLCYLINGDESGLNDSEQSLLAEFSSKYGPMAIYSPADDENEFDRCQVSGLMGRTTLLSIFTPLP